MKIITRTRKSGEYLGYYILEDNEEIKVQELEEIPYKEGHYVETYFDDKEKLVKQKYIELPRSKEQELEEELKKMKEQVEQANKAIEDLVMKNAGL
nr:MAG TPA: protein of unknown function (DUF5320) [Caudoviricetes sp.]